MKELLEYLIKNIAGDDFTVTEEELEGGRVNFNVTADPSIVGLIIGKMGRTVKTLRKILSVRAVVENKSVNISVGEKAQASIN